MTWQLITTGILDGFNFGRGLYFQLQLPLRLPVPARPSIASSETQSVFEMSRNGCQQRRRWGPATGSLHSSPVSSAGSSLHCSRMVRHVETFLVQVRATVTSIIIFLLTKRTKHVKSKVYHFPFQIPIYHWAAQEWPRNSQRKQAGQGEEGLTQGRKKHEPTTSTTAPQWWADCQPNTG